MARRQLINCYDATAFALPAQFTFGNTSRNVLRGPKFSSTDLSFMKNVPVGGTARLQVRVEIFNIFNQVNYGNPNASFGSAAFGTHHVRRFDASVPTGRKAAVLSRRANDHCHFTGAQEVRIGTL